MRSPQRHSNHRVTDCRSGKCIALVNLIIRPHCRHFRIEASSTSPIFSAMNSSIEAFLVDYHLRGPLELKLKSEQACGDFRAAGRCPQMRGSQFLFIDRGQAWRADHTHTRSHRDCVEGYSVEPCTNLPGCA